MVTFPTILTEPLPSFQGHGIFEVEYRGKTASLKHKVNIAQEETIPKIWNGTYMVGDLD